MLSQTSEYTSRVARWMGLAALVVLVPKCVLCLLAYAGLGAALGRGGVELCGAPSDATGGWIVGAAALGGVIGGLTVFRRRGLGPWRRGCPRRG